MKKMSPTTPNVCFWRPKNVMLSAGLPLTCFLFLWLIQQSTVLFRAKMSRWKCELPEKTFLQCSESHCVSRTRPLSLKDQTIEAQGPSARLVRTLRWKCVDKQSFEENCDWVSRKRALSLKETPNWGSKESWCHLNEKHVLQFCVVGANVPFDKWARMLMFTAKLPMLLRTLTEIGRRPALNVYFLARLSQFCVLPFVKFATLEIVLDSTPRIWLAFCYVCMQRISLLPPTTPSCSEGKKSTLSRARCDFRCPALL